jgi:hypothetical protein
MEQPKKVTPAMIAAIVRIAFVELSPRLDISPPSPYRQFQAGEIIALVFKSYGNSIT